MPARILLLTLGVACTPPDQRADTPFHVDLLPDEPESADTLYLRIESSAPDHDVRWYLDGEIIKSGERTLEPSAYRRGRRVRAEVTARWKSGPGATVHDEAFIGNTPPQVSDARVSPNQARVDTPLTASATISDFEGDPAKLRARWLVNGVVVPPELGTTPDRQLVRSGGWRKGDLVAAAVSAFDKDDGDEVITNAVRIRNAPPNLKSARIPGDPQALDDVRCLPVEATDADTDPITLQRVWRVNNSLQIEDGETLTGPFVRGDVVECRMRPFDGEDYGYWREASRTIGNSPPTMSAVQILPANPTELDVLRAEPVDWFDADGDPPEIAAEWRVNGRLVSQLPTLTGDLFNEGDVIQVTAAATDIHDTGPPLASAPVVVTNAVPTFVSATIAPERPQTTDTLTVDVYGWSDPDPNDVMAFSYAWTVNGSQVSTDATLAPEWFTFGDEVSVLLTVMDERIGASFAPPAVVIGNAAPDTPTVRVTPYRPTDASPLSCGLASLPADRDGDVLSYTFTWTRDGQPTGFTLTTTDDTATLIVDGTNTAPGELWRCDITVSDGRVERVAGAHTVIDDPCGTAATLALDPWAYWPLDDPLFAADLAGGFEGPVVGGAIDIGSNGLAACPSTAFTSVADMGAHIDDFDLPGGQASVSLWVYRQSGASTGGLFSMVADTDGASHDFMVSSSSTSLFTQFGSNTYTADLLTDGSWHHVVATQSGSATQLWVDGVLFIDDTSDVHILHTPAPLVLGQSARCAGGCLRQPLYGSLDEVAVFGRVLTAEEVHMLYTFGRP